MFGSMFGMFAIYISFMFPAAALSTLLIGYLILRYRDKEDAELGIKSLFSYLQFVTMQIALACVAMILVMLVTKMGGSGDSSGWRGLLGIALVNGGAWVGLGILLGKTDIDAKPAARKLFEGLGIATTLVISLIAVSMLSSTIFGWSEGSGDMLKAAMSVSVVYCGASFLLLKRQGIL
jgi:hypothetical protein